MEIALPLVALTGLFFMNTNGENKKDGFTTQLPNTNIPDKNYPTDTPITSFQSDKTSALSVENRFDSDGVYTDKYFGPQKVINSSNQSQYTSLAGDRVDKSYFEHNNMVPFFKGTAQTDARDSVNYESILDNKNGSGSQSKAKGEIAPLFDPQQNMQWAYGMPSTSDFVQSRMNASHSMNGVRLFEPEHVSANPLTAADTRNYKTEYNVDELRVANKQKATGTMLYGHEGPAKSRINTIDVETIGKVDKNRPDRHFEMTNDRLFTTTGVEKRQAIAGAPIDRYTTRPETMTSYTGVAKSHLLPAIDGEYKPSTNIELGEKPFGIASAPGRNFASADDFGMQSHVMYENSRNTNAEGEYFGIMGSAIGAVVAPLLDALRPSRKENAIGTLRPYQNPGSTVPQSYIYNPENKPAPTIRELSEKASGHLFHSANQTQGAYKNTEYVPMDTNRYETGNYQQTGAANGYKMPRNHDIECDNRNNLKSTTVHGVSMPGSMSLFNADVNMKSNPRDLKQVNTREVIPSYRGQGPSYDNMGARNEQSQQLYSGIQMDRANPDLLSQQLKENPFVHNITNYFK